MTGYNVKQSARLMSALSLGASLIGLMSVGVMANPAVADHKVMATAAADLGAERSPYANFLVGRFAMAQGDVGTASSALQAASANDPDNAALREKAFLLSIIGGHIAEARAMCDQIPDTAATSDTTRLMTRLVTAVAAIKEGKNGQALKASDVLAKLNTHERGSALLRPYILALNGQWKAAFDEKGDAALNTDDHDRLLVYLLKSERARLYEIKGDAKSADAIYKALYQPGAASFIFGPDYAEFLERQGNKDEAKAVWQTIATQSNDITALNSLKRLDAADYKAPALPDLKQSAAQALNLSATVSFGERDTELALAEVRLSLYLDGTSERERIFLGQIEQTLKDSQAADYAWASIPPDSPFYNEATLRRVWNLRTQDKLSDASALIDQALKGDPNAIGLVTEKADVLHAQNRDTEALGVLQGRIDRAGSADFNWQTLLLQAIIYDSLDRWDDAEVSIKKAQALNGARPEIQNFLGYGWINRGTHIEDGMALVRLALKSNPKSGAIMDSLGWGYYKLGEYDQALGFIEQAVQLDPSDAEVNEHLGDVYKAMGRSTEAGYEWNRVLSLKITDKQAAEVRRKISENAQTLHVVQAAKLKTEGEATAMNAEDKTRR